MTEPEIPQLHFTRDHIMAMTQLLTMLSQRLAEQRERRGRAAYSNAEHAARIAETHEHPVVRPMSEAERQAFTTQAGDPQVPQHGFNVVTAPAGQEWGVGAVTPTGDAASVMCPNITEAGRLADYLRAQNNPAAVGELNELSEQVGHRVTGDLTDAARAASAEANEPRALADLVTGLPESLTSTPEWKGTEARFVELTAQGVVDPAALVAGVQGLDFDQARRPDALVRWSLDTTAREWNAEHPSASVTAQRDSHEVAAAWADQLDPTSALDRVAASEAVGRYAPGVDATLAITYPGLLTAATDARNTGAEDEALAQHQRENAEALTAESANRFFRGDDVPHGQGSDDDLNREEAATVQDGEVAEHHDRAEEATNDVERARDEKVNAQFTPTHTTTVPRRSGGRPTPTVPVVTQTRTQGRGR